MDKYPDDPAIQIKCINSFLPLVRSNPSIETLLPALDRIDSCLNTISGNIELYKSILEFFGGIVSNNQLVGILEDTDFYSLISFLLFTNREEVLLSEICLEIIQEVIKLPSIVPKFSNSIFLENLVYISRLFPNSLNHALYTSKIAKKLDNQMLGLTDLLSVLVVYSKNHFDNEEVQEAIITAASYLANEDIMIQVGAFAINQFSAISTKYSHNQVILLGVFRLISFCSESLFPFKIIDILLEQWNLISKEYDSVYLITYVLSTKLSISNTPIKLLSIPSYSLMFYLSSSEVVFFCLQICINCLSDSNDIPSLQTLVSSVSSLIRLHWNNNSIIGKSSIVLLLLSKNKLNIDYMYNSVIILNIFATLKLDIDDDSISMLLALINIIIRQSEALISNVNRNDHIIILKSLIERFYNTESTLMTIISIIYQVVTTQYSVSDFIDLDIQKARLYSISGEISHSIIENHFNDVLLVKGALLLSDNSTDIQHLLPDIIMQYQSDKDIQVLCLYHGIGDIKLIANAIILCGVENVKLWLPLLEKSEELFPNELIHFLLQISDDYAIRLLLKQINYGYSQEVASQFEMKFINHLVIAQELSKNKLWMISEKGIEIVKHVLSGVNFNSDVLSAALYFGDTVSQIPSLNNLLRSFVICTSDKNTIIELSRFICRMSPNEKMEEAMGNEHFVGIIESLIQFYINDYDVLIEITKVIHLVSYFEGLTKELCDSVLIYTLLDACNQYNDFYKVVYPVFANLVSNQDMAIIMFENGIFKYIFSIICDETLFIVESLLRYTSFVVYEENIHKIAQFFLTKKNAPSTQTVYAFFYIIDSFSRKNFLYHPSFELSQIIQYLTSYISDGPIVEMILSVINKLEKSEDTKPLLYALIEVFHLHLTNIQIMRLSLSIYSTMFTSSSSNSLNNTPNNLIHDIIKEHKEDSYINRISFPLIIGYQPAFKLSLSSLNRFEDNNVLRSISVYISSTYSDIECSIYTKLVLSLIQKRKNCIDAEECLFQVLSRCLHNDTVYPLVLSHLSTIYDICLQFYFSQTISESFLLIIYKLSLSSRNISSILTASGLIGLIIKQWLMNTLVVKLTTSIISSFSLYDKKLEFHDFIPSFLICIQKNLCCDEIIDCFLLISWEKNPYLEITISTVLLSLLKGLVFKNSYHVIEELLGKLKNFEPIIDKMPEAFKGILSKKFETDHSVKLMQFFSKCFNESTKSMFSKTKDLIVELSVNDNQIIKTHAINILNGITKE